MQTILHISWLRLTSIQLATKLNNNAKNKVQAAKKLADDNYEIHVSLHSFKYCIYNVSFMKTFVEYIQLRDWQGEII